MLKAIILVVMIVSIAYLGTCVYSNFVARPDTGQPKMPEAEKAAYSVNIENTGNVLLTNTYEQLGGKEVGKRVFVLHGFWELEGRAFKYRVGDIILDESIFGEITIKRR